MGDALSAAKVNRQASPPPQKPAQDRSQTPASDPDLAQKPRRFLAIQFISQPPAVQQPGDLHRQCRQPRPKFSPVLEKTTRRMPPCNRAIGKGRWNFEAEQAMAEMKRGGEIGEETPVMGEGGDGRPIQPIAFGCRQILDVAQIAQAELSGGVFHVLQLGMQAAEMNR